MWKMKLKNITKSFLKNEKRKRKTRLRKAIKVAQNKSMSQENMIVYVDEKGHLTSTPPAVLEKH
jgi:hypothetical protein